MPVESSAACCAASRRRAETGRSATATTANRSRTFSGARIGSSTRTAAPTSSRPRPPGSRSHGGAKRLACVRLREGGLTRWHSACCNTPIGNTLSGNPPFVGLILHCAAPADGAALDSALGPVRIRGNARFAKGDRAALDAHDGLPLSYFLRLGLMVLGWRLRGDGARSPFFDAAGGLVAEPRVLSAEELREVEAARDAS